MAAHQSGGDLEVLLLRRLAGPQNLPHAARIGGEALLHEDVHALLDRVVQVRRAEAGVRGQQGHVARPQAVDGLAIGVEAEELPLLGHVDLLAELLAQRLVRGLQAILEQVGHGDQLDRPAGGRKGVAHRAAAAVAAADDGQPDGVVLAGVDVRNDRARQASTRRPSLAVFFRKSRRGVTSFAVLFMAGVPRYGVQRVGGVVKGHVARPPSAVPHAFRSRGRLCHILKQLSHDRSAVDSSPSSHISMAVGGMSYSVEQLLPNGSGLSLSSP